MIFGSAFRRLLATIRSGFMFMFCCLRIIPEIEKNLSMKALDEHILRSILDVEHRISKLEELLDQNPGEFFFSLKNVDFEITKAKALISLSLLYRISIDLTASSFIFLVRISP